MKKIKFWCVVVALLVTANSLFALGLMDQNAQAVQATGQVRMVGNSPWNTLVITGENREWYVDQKDQGKLKDLQQQLVTVAGIEYYKDMIFANGMPAGRRYYLKNIKIIKRDI